MLNEMLKKIGPMAPFVNAMRAKLRVTNSSADSAEQKHIAIEEFRELAARQGAEVEVIRMAPDGLSVLCLAVKAPQG